MTNLRLGGRYQLEERIGAGGAGVVWRGSDVSTGATYAIKLLRSELARNPAMMASFAAERTALLRFRHRYAVVLHDMIVEGERLALVTDYVAGGDLDDLRRRSGGTLPAAEAAALTAQICAALAAAHAAGIVHADLKPANVLLETGEVRLTDFGLARVTGEPAPPATGLTAGPVAYLAPEIVSGTDPSPACDVYAIGVMLYELLAGRPPFSGRASMAGRGRQDARPTRPEGVTAALWSLITACLDPGPGRRPAAAELASALGDPAVLDPAVLDPAVLDPAVLDPAVLDLAVLDPAPDMPEPTVAARDQPEPADPEPADPEPADPEPAEPERPVAATAGWLAAEHYDSSAESPWDQPASPVQAVPPSVPGGPVPGGPARRAADRGPANRPPRRRSRRLAWAGGVLAALAVAGVLAAALNRSPATTAASTTGRGTVSAGATATGHVGAGATAAGPVPSAGRSAVGSGGVFGTRPPASGGPGASPTTRRQGRPATSPGQSAAPSLPSGATTTSSAAPVPSSVTTGPSPAPAPSSSPTPSASPTTAANTAWQCGPAEPATLKKTGADTGQTLRACIRIHDGRLGLRGILNHTVRAWGEQIVLELTDSSRSDYGDYLSLPCTTSDCTYTVPMPAPSSGEWTVLPEWERYGNYQSTGAEAAFVDF